MEKIGETLKKKTHEVLDENYALKKMNPKLANLTLSIGATEDEIKKNLSSFEDTLDELDKCKKCPGLESCPNHLRGHVYYPNKNEGFVTFDYIPCKKLKTFNEEVQKKDTFYQLSEARMKDIDITDKSRVKLIKWIKSFYDKYDASKENKGLYLHGTFGSGKTYLIAALFNELTINKNAKAEIIYLPDLLRNLKDDFNSMDSKINYYSKVELLLIDDIGAEKVTDWGRDEVLCPILNTRMNSHLTTFFTSNLTIDELEKHLSLTKDSEDLLKARRIIERVKQLTTDEELISINRRN